MTLAGAAAAVTSQIGIGNSVINPPLRSPAVVAGAANTLDEISGGRYILGIGAGNTRSIVMA
jgi:alkanesulfonate monooxygenase SsuD/methylene tetrahydromethanopterin reductase-like flavin-dependent oxidoreductase (luciferase family)